MTPLPQLLDKIKDRPLSEDKKKELWIRIERQQTTKKPSRPWPALAVAALVIIGIGLSLYLTLGRGSAVSTNETGHQSQLVSTMERLVAPQDRERIYTFEDGSSVTLANGSSLSIVEDNDRQRTFNLEVGRVHFDVIPGGSRRWTIMAGWATIEVLGTLFSIERTEEIIHITVARGRVQVRSESLESFQRILTDGQNLAVSFPDQNRPRKAMTQSSLNEPEVAKTPRHKVVKTPRQRARRPAKQDTRISERTPQESWQELAREGDHSKAYTLLGDDHFFELANKTTSVETLMLLADTARLSGHATESLVPLSKVIREHSGDSRAALAAYTSGRVRMDSLGDAQGASRDFSRAMELGLPETLREEVYLRLVQARIRSGDRPGARSAAQQYLDTWPEGRHVQTILSLIADE